MKETRYIFLSYRSTEADFALRLAADLKNAGVNLWMDRLDIAPGDDWLYMLQQAVNDCAALIPVLSPEYVNSKYCQRELARADRLHRAIFPVLLYSIGEAELPLVLESQQYIDFTHWRDEKVYQVQVQALIKTIRERLGNQVTSTLDPTTRYVNTLIAELEVQRNIIGYFELDTSTPGLSEDVAMRPQPVFARTWNMQGRFVLLDDQDSQHRSEGRLYHGRRRHSFRDIYEALENYPRFILLGDAGTGKSATLQHLALEAAHHYRAAPDAAPLPLLLKLSNWQEEISPVEFIRSQWTLDSDPIKLVAKGKVALYLDGLNELDNKVTEKIAVLKTWMSGKNSPQRIIISCRKDDDSALWENLGIPVIEMIDLSLTHVHQFVEHYLTRQAAQPLLNHLLEDQSTGFARQLYQIARNPFLLSALLVIYNSSSEHEVLHNIGLLIRKLVLRLWERFLNQQHGATTTFEQLEAALTDLAFAMTDKDTPIYVSLEDAFEYLGSQAILQAAVDAYLLELDGKNIRFSHALIQQYFAALGLMRVDLTKYLTKPKFDKGLRRIPTRWDRVILIRAAIDIQTDAIVLQICDIDPYLALRCALNLLPNSSPAYQSVTKQLVEQMTGNQRVALAHTFMGIDDEKAFWLLIEILRDGSWVARQAAARLIQEIELSTLPGLTQALEDLEDKTRDTTLVALRQLGKSALPTLFLLLHHNKWHLRRNAAWGLGALKEKAAIPLLMDTLHDLDHMVIIDAATALGRIKDQAAVSELIGTLDHENWRVGKAVARALAEIGKPVISDLIHFLEANATTARQQIRAIDALAQIKDEQIAEALVKISQASNVDVRGAAIEAMRNHLSGITISRLIHTLSDKGKPRWSKLRICDIAASILEGVDIPEAKNAIKHWQKHNGITVPSTDGAGRPSGKKGRERLERIKRQTSHLDGNTEIIAALQDADWLVRRDAVMAQAGVKTDLALPRLKFALQDEDSQVRLASVNTLVKHKDTADITILLIQALNDEESSVSDAAKDALKKIAKPPATELRQLISASEVNVRAAAIEILGSIGDTTAISELTDCLSDIRKPWLSDQRVCDIAARALETIGTPEAKDALHKWRKVTPRPTKGEQPQQHPEILSQLLKDLHDEDWNIRHDAAKTLREYARVLRGTKDAQVIASLTAALLDGDWVVRWAAVEALGWISAPSSLPSLTARLNDDNWMVRGATIRAFIEIGDRTSASAIVPMLADTNNMVREAAAEALGHLLNPLAVPALMNALSDHERLVRLAAIEALGKIGDTTAVRPLIANLKDADYAVRWLAVAALGKLASVEPVEALIDCLKDGARPAWEDRRVCDIAAEVLQSIGTPKALKAVALWREKLAEKTVSNES